MRVMRLRIGTVWRAAMRGGYRFRDVPGGLEQQRRFADAGFAGDEHHRTRHYAAAEYTVELAEASGESVHRVGGDARDRLRRALHIRHRDGRARGAARRRRACPGCRRSLMEFLDGAPLAAFRASAIPFAAAPATFGAHIVHGFLRHATPYRLPTLYLIPYNRHSGACVPRSVSCSRYTVMRL